MFAYTPSRALVANFFHANPGLFKGTEAQSPSLFNELWSDHFSETRNPRAQVDSDESSITLSLDVPGLSKEQLTLSLEERVLRIASKDDAPRSFKAAYKIAADIDASKTEAKLENGVLTLKLAKLPAHSRETLISIQ